ncbi:response regulator transcription factor [Clostridium paraputrificum]|uniref:response regulator transcription factor n=1 Tax=Clostridium paraputrificum TaxID=29363 RepID=UPI003D32E79C
MEKVLIIEDNKDVNLLLAETLKDEGYEVESSYDGLGGIKAIMSKEFNIILLDIMLPYKSGDEILKEIREFTNIPVIIISAKDMIGTKIDLLRLGADDYITKPFDLGEVAARVESNLRRVQGVKKGDLVLMYKDMNLDLNRKTVTINGEELILTAKEYCMLELFLGNKGKIFSKANIYETIWNEEYFGDDNSVKTHMSNLRNKLKKANSTEEYIETVWGLGYRLCKEDK